MSKQAAQPQPVAADLPDTRPRRSGWFDWVPTDAAQLAMAEEAMLKNLRHPHHRRHVVGINTLTMAVHHDMPAAASAGARTSKAKGTGRSGHVAAADAAAPDHVTVAAAEAAAAALDDVRRERHVVLLHGFAGGLAMWMPNLDALMDAAIAQEDKRQFKTTFIHAIDMPGFARSERRWRHIASAEAAIEYMTEWLQEWLKAMGIVSKDRAHLDIVGHSFGGYISAQLAMRRPDIVSHLFLADPWGVQPKAEEDDIASLPMKWKVIATCFYSALPFSLLRLAGPLGPKLLPSLRPDFAHRWRPFLSDPSVFFDYTYHCNASSQAVGEFLFQSCCHGLVCAKLPLAQDLPEKLPRDVALTLAYGTKTWMDQHAGYEMLERMKEAHPEALRTFANVEGAGHQISTDNVAGFNQLLIQSVFPHAAGGGGHRRPRH